MANTLDHNSKVKLGRGALTDEQELKLRNVHKHLQVEQWKYKQPETQKPQF